MILCVCRNISPADYPNHQEYMTRIMEPDHVCGSCQEFLLNQAQACETLINKTPPEIPIVAVAAGPNDQSTSNFLQIDK